MNPSAYIQSGPDPSRWTLRNWQHGICSGSLEKESFDWVGRFDDIVSTVTSDSLRVCDSEIFTSLSKLEPGGHLRKAHPELGAAGEDGYVVG